MQTQFFFFVLFSYWYLLVSGAQVERRNEGASLDVLTHGLILPAVIYTKSNEPVFFAGEHY